MEEKVFTFSSKLSSKSQIVIPKKIREALELKEGDGVILTLYKDIVFLSKEPKDWYKYLEKF